jgi:hypothetical protein
MSRGAIALAVAALALGLLVGTALDRSPSVPMPVTDGSTESTPAATGVAPDATTAENAAADAAREPGTASGPNIATARFTTPLPPENTPLVSALPALQAAAEAGSIEAIRRLLEDTQRCHLHAQARFGLDVALSMQEDLKRMAAGQGPKVVVAMPGEGSPEGLFGELAEGAAGKMSADQAFCEGHDDPDGTLRFEAQWRAALAGDVEGLIRFVLDPEIDTGRAWQQFDRIERYRERAPAFLQQALAAGSTQAARHLMDAHDPGWSREAGGPGPKGPTQVSRYMLDRFPPPPVRQVFAQDAAIAWRYATLCERVCPEHAQQRARAVLDRLRPELDAATRARAEEEAARLREAHFAGVREVPWFPDLNDQPAPGDPPQGP